MMEPILATESWHCDNVRMAPRCCGNCVNWAHSYTDMGTCDKRLVPQTDGTKRLYLTSESSDCDMFDRNWGTMRTSPGIIIIHPDGREELYKSPAQYTDGPFPSTLTGFTSYVTTGPGVL